MGRKIVLVIVMMVALAAVGVGAFYGGTVYAAQQATTTRDAFFAGRGGGDGRGAGGAGAPGPMARAGLAAG